MKDRIVSDILIAIQGEVTQDSNQLNRIKNILINAMFKVEVVEKETALTTERDTNEQMLKEFFVERKMAGRSERTLKQYYRSITKFMGIVDKRLNDVTSNDVLFYLYNYFPDCQASTVNNEKRFLSAVFGWLEDRERIKRNPVKNVEIARPVKKPVDYLKAEEILRIRDSCVGNIRQRALFEFLLSTGCRIGEVSDITLDSINFSNGKVTVKGNKRGPMRNTRISDEAMMYVKKYINDRKGNSEYLFCNERFPYKQTTTVGLQSVVRDIKKKSDIDRLYPHLCRHTMATRASQGGMQPVHIKEMLGHISFSTTNDYYIGSNSEMMMAEHRRCVS